MRVSGAEARLLGVRRGGAPRMSERAGEERAAGRRTARKRAHGRGARGGCERAAGRPGTVREASAGSAAVQRREVSEWRAGWAPADPGEGVPAR